MQIDELVRAFDRPTRRAFQGWIRELAGAIEKGRGEDLNDAIGNLPGFVATGDDVLAVLDDQKPALQALIRNSGRTLEAVNEREGQLRQLIVNGDRFFGALASRNDALAETVFVLPTFLDETRTTVRRLRRFSVNTRPLVRDLQPVATDLEPTLRDVGRLAPDLKALFRDLSPLIDESEDTLPAAARFLRGAEPLFEGLHAYLPELNPILSFANFQQSQLSDFIMNGAGSLSATLPPVNSSEGPRHYLRQFGAINARGLGLASKRPGLGASELLSRPQLPEALEAAGHRRVVRLQALGRHQAHRHRGTGAVLRAAQVAVRRAPVPAPAQGRLAAAKPAAGQPRLVPGQPVTP